MKKILCVLIMCFTVLIMSACGEGNPQEIGTVQKESENNHVAEKPSLVVYFSATGNTESVAEVIADIQEAELYEIVPKDPYTDEDLDYNNDESRTSLEQNDDDIRPLIAGEKVDIKDYDTIYVGFPIWWNDMPKIIYTFFDTYDFSGKTIMPFCTSGSSDISEAVENIEKLEPDASVMRGLRTSEDEAQKDITIWIDNIVK